MGMIQHRGNSELITIRYIRVGRCLIFHYLFLGVHNTEWLITIRIYDAWTSVPLSGVPATLAYFIMNGDVHIWTLGINIHIIYI